MKKTKKHLTEKLMVRVDPATKRQLLLAAHGKNSNLSVVTREALDEYLKVEPRCHCSLCVQAWAERKMNE